MRPRSLECNKEDAQSVSNPDHLDQTHSIHLSRKYFLRVPQGIVREGREEMCPVGSSVCAAGSFRRVKTD